VQLGTAAEGAGSSAPVRSHLPVSAAEDDQLRVPDGVARRAPERSRRDRSRLHGEISIAQEPSDVIGQPQSSELLSVVNSQQSPMD